MKTFLAILLATAPPTDTGTIASADASYDGNALVLKGEVVLDHGLGKMEADEAVLERQEEGKDFPFSIIHLHNKVHLQLKNSAQMECENADFDFTNLKGILTDRERVIYIDSFKGKKGKITPLKLLSHAIDLQLMKKEASYEIESILAKENVEVTYAENYTLFSDAVTHKQGVIKSTSRCKLVHLTDVIESDQFSLDTTVSKLHMLHPTGTFGKIGFSAEELIWDHEKNFIALKGNPSIEEPGFGKIVSDTEIHLFHKEKQPSLFKSFGKTTVNYLNHHKLVSHGILVFDREKKIGTVDHLEGEQLYYEEGEMGLSADKAHIEYTEENGSFQPVSVALNGHVKIFSHAIGTSHRLGMADRVTYSPQTRTFILGADRGKKVIFSNEEEGLKISAQEVHITQDPATKKQTVKGIGNVQFALSAEEEAELSRLLKHE